jgi:hypothetical protein
MNLSDFKTLEQLASAIKSLNMVTVVNWTDYSATSTTQRSRFSMHGMSKNEFMFNFISGAPAIHRQCNSPYPIPSSQTCLYIQQFMCVITMPGKRGWVTHY